MKVLLTGWQYMDFPARDDPNKKIQGYNLYLAIEKEHVNGFIPVSDEGKRFISLTSANKLGVSQSFLAQHELNLLDVDVDFNGKICDIREWNGD